MSFFSASHDFAVFDALRRRLLVAASMKASRFVLAVSAFTQREIEGLFPDLGGRVVHVPHGSDDDLASPPDRQAARAALGVRGPMILTVGTILNRRPLPILARAAGRLRHRWPELTLHVSSATTARAHASTSTGWWRTRMEGRVRLEDSWTTPRSPCATPPPDVAVFLSDYEGFGCPPSRPWRAACRDRRRAPVAGRGSRRCRAARGAAGRGAAVAAAIDRLLGDAALRADMVRRGRILAGRFS